MEEVLMESFCHGDKISFELRPTCVLDQHDIDIIQHMSQNEYDIIMRYMLHPSFRDWISNTVSREGSNCFSRCFGFRADIVKALSDKGDMQEKNPAELLGVVVIGTLYMKDEAIEAARDLNVGWARDPTNVRALLKDVWTRVFPFSSRYREKARGEKKRIQKARRILKKLATYDEVWSHIPWSIYEESVDAGSQPEIPGIDNVPLLLFEYIDERITAIKKTKPLSRMSVADSRLEPFERDVLCDEKMKRFTSPTGVFTMAARRWKDILTNPYHPRGRAFLYAQFSQICSSSPPNMHENTEK